MRIKILVLMIIFSVSSIMYAEWFRLGRVSDKPFQFETSVGYEKNYKYYDSVSHKMLDFPEDWVYKTYDVTTRIGVYFTKNIRVRFSFPYSYIHEVRFTSSGEQFTGGTGLANYEVDLKYQFCYFKYGLLGFFKKGSLVMSYLFDNGNKEEIAHSISYGRNEIDGELDFDFFIIPNSVNQFFHKNLLLKSKIVYEKTGRVMSGLYSYSKSGFDRGDKLTSTLTLSYQLNSYIKVEGYWYYFYTFPLKDINNKKVSDSYEYEHDLGFSMSWRPLGQSAIDLKLKSGFPISYKTSYVPLFSPQVSVKFTF